MGDKANIANESENQPNAIGARECRLGHDPRSSAPRDRATFPGRSVHFRRAAETNRSRSHISHLMSSQFFEEFSKAPAPGFRCYAAGAKSGARFLAKVRHILNAPASSTSVADVRHMLDRHANPVAAFYQRHDGFVLYRDTISEAAGIELLPVARWEEATADMRNWFEHLADEPESDPDHIVTGIAIATVPHSGNYFVMPVEGPTAGKIFYADHDGWYESAFANDFDGFLAHVTREPAKLLAEELGCYTRYSDGKTSAQWIPDEYFADISSVAV